MSGTSKAAPINVVAAAALGLTVVACDEGAWRELSAGQTPHERYVEGLRAAGLDQTALGRDWIAAGRSALEQPVAVEAPYHEVSYLDARETGANGYALDLRRGQRITASFEMEGDSAARVFLDMFVIPNGAAELPILLTTADSLERELEYVARRDGQYLLRVQPELLRGGRYEVTIVVSASLAFPVQGVDTTAIRSWFGAPREGGRRSHHGLDIFAPRGTPVIAAAQAVVRSTRPNRLGGKVVWLRDELGRSLYYAHLDSQVVRRGEIVAVGDTIGFVGNSGNARTTPPHLHFGVYERGFGPSDPYPALHQPSTVVTPFEGDQSLIGVLARAARNRTRVRLLPHTKSRILMELPLHTPLRVLAGSGSWYRVALPDGTSGFVSAALAERADRPIRSEVVASGAVLLSQPAYTADPVEDVEAGAELPVLGAFGEFLYVQTPSGRAGWVSLD